MQNLYNEIEELLQNNALCIQDIKWIGNNSFIFDNVDEALELFKLIDYDNGYGGEEIATDLIIVGDKWWLERHNYDGSEWFEFKTKPLKKTKHLKGISVEDIKIDW